MSRAAASETHSPPGPSSALPDFPGADRDSDALLRHVGSTGAIWFIGALIACSLPITGLLAAGWRPARLPDAAAAVWWASSAVAAAGIVALALAGCPVVGDDPDASARRRSLAVRAGVVLVLVGGAAALVTVLVD